MSSVTFKATKTETFLAPVIEASQEFLDQKDQQGNLPTSQQMLRCAQIAMGQVQAYMNRPFIKDGYLDVFNAVYERRVRLTVEPLVSVASVIAVFDYSYRLWSNNQVEEISMVEGTDYEVELNLNGIKFLQTDNTRYETFPQLRVEYEAGHSNAANDSTLLTALAMQTAAVRKRTPTIGLSSFSPGGPQGGNYVNASNSGGLTSTVRDMLQPYIYMGPVDVCQT